MKAPGSKCSKGLSSIENVLKNISPKVQQFLNMLYLLLWLPAVLHQFFDDRKLNSSVSGHIGNNSVSSSGDPVTKGI